MRQLSIVIPVFNREKLLTHTLESIRNQTYRPLEIILVDNNSMDNSLAVCESFKNKYHASDFKIEVASETKKGANAARNKGLQMVTSEYVLFYDSDDEMYPHKMQKIAETIEQKGNPDIVATTVNYKFPDDSRKPRAAIYSNRVERQILTGFLSSVTTTVKTSLLKEVGGWNEAIFRWQDWELGVRLLLKTNQVAWFKKPALDDIYIHDESITGASFSGSHQEIATAIESVNRAIIQSDAPKKDKLLLSVQFKKLIVAGDFYREGNQQLSRQWLTQILSSIPTHKKWLFHMIYFYKTNGGRGAWRFFEWFV